MAVDTSCFLLLLFLISLPVFLLSIFCFLKEEKLFNSFGRDGTGRQDDLAFNKRRRLHLPYLVIQLESDRNGIKYKKEMEGWSSVSDTINPFRNV
jgi:hypothetical protein